MKGSAFRPLLYKETVRHGRHFLLGAMAFSPAERREPVPASEYAAFQGAGISKNRSCKGSKTPIGLLFAH